MDDHDDDRIPAVAWHRGCAIEDQQPSERIELVKRAIDYVHGLSLDDADVLVSAPRAVRRRVGCMPRRGLKRCGSLPARNGACDRGSAWI